MSCLRVCKRMSGVEPSHFPEDSRIALPTPAQLISGDFTSTVSVTATYRTIFRRTEHVGDCLVYVRQQFLHCSGEGMRIGVQPEDKR